MLISGHAFSLTINKTQRALQARNQILARNYFALSGFDSFIELIPGALPRAISFHAYSVMRYKQRRCIQRAPRQTGLTTIRGGAMLTKPLAAASSLSTAVSSVHASSRAGALMRAVRQIARARSRSFGLRSLT